MDKVVSEEKLSELLDVSESTLKSWRQKRKIPYHKLGRAVRYDLGEVKKWLEQHRVASISP